VLVLPLTIKVKIAKMGNSIRMTIPKPVVEALGWADGDIVGVGVEDNKMVVEKA